MGGGRRVQPCAPSALTQIVPKSASIYTVFHSVIFNFVIWMYLLYVRYSSTSNFSKHVRNFTYSTTEASLKVEDFNSLLYSSSCNDLLFGLFLAALRSLSSLYHHQDRMACNKIKTESKEKRMRQKIYIYMNCRTQKL